MSSELSSNKDHWQKTADRYLGVARASAASTSAVAFLWMIAIIISVLSFVDEADKGKTAIIKAQEAYLQASNDFDNAICDLSRLKSDKEFKCQSNSSEINELKKGYKSSYKSNKFDKTKCESEKKKEKKERDVELIILCVYEQVKATEEELRSAQSSTTELKLPTFPSFKIKRV